MVLHTRLPLSVLAAGLLLAGLLLGACVSEAQDAGQNAAQTAAQGTAQSPVQPAAQPGAATPPVADSTEADARLYEQAVTRGMEFLTTTQAADGSFSKQAGPGVTALVISALLRHGRPASDPLVAKALVYLETFVQPDGSIGPANSVHKNYETCLAILAFQAASEDGKYDKLLASASEFLQQTQWDDAEGHDKSSPAYGGAGHGAKKRPDLSNTVFLVDALKATGANLKSEALQKAVVFVSRCQNLESAHNTLPPAGKVNDGGFYHTPMGEGESPAGKSDNGGLRSYGSMTCAGISCMLAAGVKPKDPRVRAASAWVQKNFDLKVNPGLGTPGLYFYYHTCAKTLDMLGLESIQDSASKPRHWRSELLQELISRQLVNGAWVNPDLRWLEGDPNLATGYALLTLISVKSPAEWKVKAPAPLIAPPPVKVKPPRVANPPPPSTTPPNSAVPNSKG